MTINEQIAQILNRRRENITVLEKKKTDLSAIQDLLNRILDTSLEMADIRNDELQEQLRAISDNVTDDVKDILKKCNLLKKKFNDGIGRFDRKYISIATIGKERQGKSKFLQSVGDLDDNIIPAFNASSCTGAVSVIWNDSRMAPHTVRAEIKFKKKADLVNTVLPYILSINPECEEAEGLTFDDIGDLNRGPFLRRLKERIGDGDATKNIAYNHLTQILNNYDGIKDLFDSPSITLSDSTQIMHYVAQNNGKAADDPLREDYINYLAVDRADIFCPFYTDVGAIRLVDTIGIGDTKLGIEEAMLNTVNTECDAAIVVTRPISGVQTSDEHLYNLLHDKFADRNTQSWLFYLVNHIVSENDNTVQSFKNDIIKGNFAVADVKIVDCSDKNAVKDEFLIPMLDTLMNNLTEIDRVYLKNLESDETKFFDEVSRFLERMPNMSQIRTCGNVGVDAFDKGKACFNKFTGELRKKVWEFNKVKNKPNLLLWNEVQKILNNLDSIIPDAEKIQSIADQNGALLGETIWLNMLHFIRNEITSKFTDINDVLETETKKIKKELVECLFDELHDLSVAVGVTDKGNSEPDDYLEWIANVTKKLFTDNKEYAQIKSALDFIYQFDFSVRAQLIQEVRRQMYIINPLSHEYAKPEINFMAQECGESIYYYLTSRMSVIEDEMRYHLIKLYRLPNLAYYAAAEEFYDRLTFASNIGKDGKFVSVEDTWGHFFQQYSIELVNENAKKYEDVERISKQFDDTVNMVREKFNSVRG